MLVQNPIYTRHCQLTLDSTAQEDDQAINQSNVIKGDALRHAKPQTSNGYNEGPGEDDLPQ